MQASPPRTAREKPKIGPVSENGALFARLQAFLPALKESNDKLSHVVEDGGTMELPEQYDGKHVELDLACGVFDLNNEDAVRAAEKNVSIPQEDTVHDNDVSDIEEGETIHPGIQELD